MKVAVIGAGAIGGYVGGLLANLGHDVTFVARGAQLDAMQSNGLKLVRENSEIHLPKVKAVAKADGIGPVDLILLTVKLLDTDEAARSFPALLHDTTRIITLQNGIDGKRLISRHVEEDRVSAGSIFLSAFVSNPGVIQALSGMNAIIVDSLGGDPVIKEFAASINKTDALSATSVDGSERPIWGKFVPLSAFSGITSLTRLEIGQIREDPEKLLFYEQLVDETIAVAAALGHVLGPEVRERALEIPHTQPYETKSSLLLDIEAGKKCEIAYLSGRVHQLGKELGVSTPGHTAVWIALSAYQFGTPD